jgi:hypothetical protein
MPEWPICCSMASGALAAGTLAWLSLRLRGGGGGEDPPAEPTPQMPPSDGQRRELAHV